MWKKGTIGTAVAVTALAAAFWTGRATAPAFKPDSRVMERMLERRFQVNDYIMSTMSNEDCETALNAYLNGGRVDIRTFTVVLTDLSKDNCDVGQSLMK